MPGVQTDPVTEQLQQWVRGDEKSPGYSGAPCFTKSYGVLLTINISNLSVRTIRCKARRW